jgi:hypothetical protein
MVQKAAGSREFISGIAVNQKRTGVHEIPSAHSSLSVRYKDNSGVCPTHSGPNISPFIGSSPFLPHFFISFMMIPEFASQTNCLH